MSRPVDVRKREDLLREVVAYLEQEGVANLSLRPLAAELGTSARMLLHYFGSKEALVAHALRSARPDVAGLLEGVNSIDALRVAAHAMWRSITRGAQRPSVNVLNEVLGLAIAQPNEFGGFAAMSVTAWVEPVRDALIGVGRPEVEATTVATILVSGLRGLAVDLAVTRQRTRVDRAAALLIERALV